MADQYISSPFVMFKGNHIDPKFTYKLNGVAQDISSAALTFALMVSEYDTTVLFERKNTAASGGDDEISWVSDGTNGEFYVHIIPTNTSTLDEGTYWWEIKMVLNGKTTTLGQNKLEIYETGIP